MLKKILITCVLLVLFTGCTVNYNINLDDTVKENINISLEENENKDIDIYSGEMNEPLSFIDAINMYNNGINSVLSNQATDIYGNVGKIKGTIYYKTKIKSNPTYSLNMNSKFKLKDLEYLNSVKTCYEKFSVLNYGSYIDISTSNKNMCFIDYPILNKINVTIKTKYYVEDNNADKVENNFYIWTIDKSNYNNKYIYIKINKNKLAKTNKSIPVYIILIAIFASILIIGGIIYLFARHLIRKNNKI